MRDYTNLTLTNTTSTYHDYGIPVVATLSFFLVTSMILALGGNIMVIITILKHPGMRTRTNMLLGNLAVADILVAVLDMPIALYTIINHDWVLPKGFCDFNGFAVGLGLMLSVHTLMWISLHKFFSITRPFARNVTQFQIALMMVAAWVWTIMYNLTGTPLIGMTRTVYKKGSSQCGPVIPNNTLQFVHSALNTSCNLLIPMIVMVYCYYKIFKEVQTHLERMRDFADVGMRNSFIQQKQITITLIIVLVVFFIFWFPYIIYSMSLVFCGESCVPLVFNPISYLFGYMNSACNPVIYALRSPSFRRGFKEIICGRASRIPGRRGGLLMSFRTSIFRTSEGGRIQQIGGRQYAAAPSRRPVCVPRVSVVACISPVVTLANGDAHTPVTLSKDPGDASETNAKSVSLMLMDGSNLIQSDTSSGSDSKLNCAAWEPLQPMYPMNHLSRSCQEIMTSTSNTVTRSASVGDIQDLLHDTKTEKVKVDKDSKRRNKSEVHRPLMWQASVDHLTTPVGRRRRCVIDRTRSDQSQEPHHYHHLGVRKFIRNFRKSLGDLFSIEEH